jgi:hypothetical protein
MPFDQRRAYTHAAAFIVTGCSLGACLGWLWDTVRRRWA